MSTVNEANQYEISTDSSRLNVHVIHAFLTQSYWSPGVPRTIVEQAIANSLCFGVYLESEQVGFARVITDKTTFGYLADVFILEPHRGKGLAKQLIKVIMAHPDLQGLRRFMLATKDAHGLYNQYGFTELANPSRIMEKFDPDVYQRMSRQTN
jgi:N-acetylglutamate synthase-like GNAT family acetyltransferase